MNINDNDTIVEHTDYAHDGEYFDYITNCGKIVKKIFFKSGKFNGQLKEVESKTIRLKRTIKRTNGYKKKCDTYLSGWIPVKNNGKLDHDQVKYISTYYITKNPPKEYWMKNHTGFL